MTLLNEPPTAIAEGTAAAPTTAPARKPLGRLVVSWITSTDHKVIGYLYLITSFAFFLIGGVMALVMRAELARPGLQFVSQRAVQPAVHDARHDHAADVRDAAVRRLRQRDHAAADRLARRRVPAAEHVQLLAVPVRRPDRPVRLPDPGRRGRLRLVRLRPADQRGQLARRRRRPVDHGPGPLRSRHDPRLRSTSSPRSSACACPA